MDPGGSQYQQMGKTYVNPHLLPRREKAGRYAQLCGGPKPADAERPGARNGQYEPIGEEDILTLQPTFGDDVNGINKYSEIGNGSAVKMQVIPLENEK